MERLWAPWRMEFIRELRAGSGGCLFCELALAGDDRERLVLHRGSRCYVVMNRYPYNNGHMMIVPHQHAGRLSELSEEEGAEVMRLSSWAADIMTRVLEAEGFNCGFNVGRCAGAGIVDHLHLHVVPRWCGDSNFLPVIGETRSMPEYLTATYDRLRLEFDRLGVPGDRTSGRKEGT